MKSSPAAYNPSWTEVLLGAVLSAILGVILGAVLLIVRPVSVVKELPKEEERGKGTVYYIEGSKDAGKGRQAVAKRNAFVAGQSVTATEDEINSLLGGPAKPTPAPGTKGGPAPKAGDKKGADKKADKKAAAADAAPAPGGGLLTAGTPNVRIRDGLLQLGIPVTIDVMGAFQQNVIVQSRGGFVKEGDMFVYDPNVIYLGSCPVHRLPFLSSYVRNKVLKEQNIPEDVVAAWRKATNVTVEGSTLKIAIQ